MVYVLLFMAVRSYYYILFSLTQSELVFRMSLSLKLASTARRTAQPSFRGECVIMYRVYGVLYVCVVATEFRLGKP